MGVSGALCHSCPQYPGPVVLVYPDGVKTIFFAVANRDLILPAGLLFSAVAIRRCILGTYPGDAPFIRWYLLSRMGIATAMDGLSAGYHERSGGLVKTRMHAREHTAA